MSKTAGKSPRFFCETCGSEVPRDAKKCPKCGKYFASVCCPACGFIGEEALFKDGCPVCGYSAASAPQAAHPPAEKKRAPGALPVWIYILTAVVFTAIFAALFFTLFK